MKATQTNVWAKLQTHYDQTKSVCLDDLFSADPQRAQHMTVRVGALTADFSRSHVTAETLSLLQELAGEQKLEWLRGAMFAGEKINVTEKRAVLHTALRAQNDTAVSVDGQDVKPMIRKTQAKMFAFAGDVRSGKWVGATGQKIKDVVNIGIGGSDLGPRFVVGALRAMATGPRVHFVANVDAADLKGVLADCNPETTLFVVVSKTFTTQETLLNARSARSWLTAALGDDAVASHFVAVSTNAEAAQAFGIDTANMFDMWDWVGGRYSLWSAVGLSIALSVGPEAFMDLLKGAAEMDDHFRSAPLTENLPFLLGAIGLWYRNFWGTSAIAILPYSERLRDLPRFLQQLDMESNGKSVTREGEAVDYATGPVVFGECGSVGQHSFHQWLHQGTGIVPADFIGIVADDMVAPEHHAVLAAHRQAQAKALQSGRQSPDPARVNPGNKPSTMLMLDRLDPKGLGALLALYEHKVFVQGALWGINSFDQFGVELGKQLAGEILAAQSR